MPTRSPPQNARSTSLSPTPERLPLTSSLAPLGERTERRLPGVMTNVVSSTSTPKTSPCVLTATHRPLPKSRATSDGAVPAGASSELGRLDFDGEHETMSPTLSSSRLRGHSLRRVRHCEVMRGTWYGTREVRSLRRLHRRCECPREARSKRLRSRMRPRQPLESRIGSGLGTSTAGAKPEESRRPARTRHHIDAAAYFVRLSSWRAIRCWMRFYLNASSEEAAVRRRGASVGPGRTRVRRQRTHVEAGLGSRLGTDLALRHRALGHGPSTLATSG